MPESAISLPVSLRFEVNQGLCLSAPCDTKSRSNTNDEDEKREYDSQVWFVNGEKDTQMERYGEKETA